jgi:hypothetical protein
MSNEKVERIFGMLESNIKKRSMPLYRSLVVSHIASVGEKYHDNKLVGLSWKTNTVLLREYVQKNKPNGVLLNGITLTLLKESDNSQLEWDQRWLRGNGLTLLQDAKVKKELIDVVNDERNWRGVKLIKSLNSFLSTDLEKVKDIHSLSDIPEIYSMFMTFLVCWNLYGSEVKGCALELVENAVEKLKNPQVLNVMSYFREIEDTKDLYKKFETFKDWVS